MHSVAQAFAATAREFATHEALLDMKTHETISYSQLFAVAAKCAKQYFSSNMLIMVAIEEGKDLVGIQLAAWLAGAAVCPFDCKRDPRVLSVIERLRPDYIVISNDEDDATEGLGFTFQRARDLLDWNATACFDFQAVCNVGEATSHLVFTSGTSTGQPKCVGVSNQSLLDFTRAKQKKSQMCHKSRIFLASTLVFDPQLGDIATALTCGAALILPNRKTCFFGGKFREALLESKCTHVTTTPAVLKLGFNIGAMGEVDVSGLCLEEVLVGGERMPNELVKQFLKTSIRLVNTYGVTECCVYQTAKLVQQVGDECFLGEAYDGVRVELLDFNSNNAVAAGQEGEICLFGSFLGKGYVTSDRTSFANPMGGFCGTFYRTGDVGVRETYGEIRYLGRRDSQYKVNGVRIEAEEVEYQLASSGLCVAAVVGFQAPHLIAFCVFKDKFPTVQTPKCVNQIMFKHLSTRLPQTHIPSQFIAVDSIPLSPTGKVDRRQLMNNYKLVNATDDDSNEDSDEQGTFASFIQHVWAEVLGISKSTVSLWDSFQSLGGDSLQALKVVNKILSRVRDIEQEVVQLANVESQVFGEITGPFSAMSLLNTPSLKAYVDALQPYIPESAFHVDERPTKAEDDNIHDITDPDPGLSRALMDCARLGLRHTLECVLGFDSICADGRFKPRKVACKTPLHQAAQFGRLDCVQLLLERGARVMAVTEARISPLHLASTPEIVLRLVAALRAQRPNDCTTPMFICDRNDQTPIHFAARAGRWQVIKAYIDEQNTFNPAMTGKGMNMFDHWRRTPLHWAVVNFHTECAKFLLENGCDVLPQGMKIGKPGPGTHLIQETPFQVAERRNAPQELKDLLRQAEAKVKG